MINAIEKKHKVCVVEIAVAFYMNAFTILRPLMVFYSFSWKIVLPLILIPIAAISIMIRNYKMNTMLLRKFTCFFCIVTFFFLVDFILRRNGFIWENYFSFLIYGAATGFFLINVKRYDKLLKYWIFFSIISGMMYILDPLNNYAYSGGYMNFGRVMLPAFIASLIAVSYYRIRVTAILTMVFFVEIVVYANKGATISTIAVIIFFYVFNTEDHKKRMKRTIVLLALVVVLLLLWDAVFEAFNMIAVKIGVGSYSLTDFKNIFQINELSSYNSRALIWNQVAKEWKDCWLFGMGIGGFQSKYNNYAHNFFMDLFITHGVIIGGLIIWLLYRYIKNTMRFMNYSKEIFLLSISMLFLWFFPSQFSFTYWKLDAFWVFVIINMYNRRNWRFNDMEADKRIRYI